LGIVFFLDFLTSYIYCIHESRVFIGGGLVVDLKEILNSGNNSKSSSEDDGWININNSAWTPERPGDTIEGELVEKKFNVGRWNHTLYVIRRRDGSCRDVWGCYRLDKKMEEITAGDIIRIRYKGEITKSDGEFMYDYDVLKKIK